MRVEFLAKRLSSWSNGDPATCAKQLPSTERDVLIAGALAWALLRVAPSTHCLAKKRIQRAGGACLEASR
jgi:hypothetical protein